MNIVLTGMPASGKSAAARALKNTIKKYKHYDLADTDKIIEQTAGMTINEIFALYGEDYFRQIETYVLEEILKKDNQIISTGGGIIKSDANLKLIKEKSISVYLKTDMETLIERAQKSSERPSLNNLDIEMQRTKLEMLYKERKSRYEQAHIAVETKGLTPEQTAQAIMEQIDEYCKRQNKSTE